MKKLFAVILIACLLLSAASALAAKQPPKQPPKGQAPEGGPQMLDLDSMVKDGVISQETRDKIQAYMEANRPEGAAPCEAPAEPEEPDDDDDDDAPEGLRGELLNTGVITQEECDAMAAVMPEEDD